MTPVKNRIAIRCSNMRSIILSLMAFAISACDSKIEPWIGVVEAPEVLQGSTTYKVEKGTFHSFIECEHAMKAEAARMDPFSMKQENGYMWRLIWLKCVQQTNDANKKDAEIIIESRGERVTKPN
jgi:hypothetical protein